jgi:hypothetical protein
MSLIDLPEDVLYNLMHYVLLSDAHDSFGSISSTCKFLRDLSLSAQLYRGYLCEACGVTAVNNQLDDVSVRNPLIDLRRVPWLTKSIHGIQTMEHAKSLFKVKNHTSSVIFTEVSMPGKWLGRCVNSSPAFSIASTSDGIYLPQIWF